MDMALESAESVQVHKCLRCGHNVSDPLANISPSSSAYIPLGYIREWQDSDQSSCALCKLIVAVIEDASLHFGFAQANPAFLKFIPKDRYTLLGLKFKVSREKYAYKDDVDSIFIYPKVGPESNSQTGLCSYKSIPRRADSDMCLETIKKWLDDCKESHHACGLSCASPLPTRVLDIEGSDARLVDNLTEVGNYVALSYCWGQEEFLKTEKSTIESHKMCIKLQSMPQNFKDAIYISKALGYKYLWIDSLCIIQDDEQDWHEQSKLMENVYHRADLVLAATCASTAKDGFLTEERPPYREGTVSITSQDTDEPEIFYYRLAPPHRSLEGPLDQRAWAFQERLRARRYLSFRSREVAWSCQTTLRCECESAEVTDHHRLYRERSLEVLLSLNTAQELHKRWRQEIVTFYTLRKLTRSTDKLRALSAIASWFEKKLSDNYLAGLWEQDLVLDLLWTTAKPGRRETYKGSTELYEAPTWSWMACDTWTYYPLDHDFNVVRLATFIRSHIYDNLSEPLGVPQFGAIMLLGKLAQATLTHDPSAELFDRGGPFVIDVLNVDGIKSRIVNPDIFPPGRQDGLTNGESLIRRQWSPGEFEGRPYSVRVLFLAFYPSLRYLHGIILVRSLENLAAYCRVGLAIFKLNRKDDINEMMNQLEDEQVTIV
ncbi:heterokaryon incompatibility protein-domain-containing protein [Hypoxylon cercidicola]|nr:heterokaryon incompatibility protein-domain-containing protein [Hypoxylon cercidicola]